MEEKIEVGEYVRTKNGVIGKIIKEDKNCRYYGELLEDRYFLLDKIEEETETNIRIADFNIVKHSKNIIDLIEEGDYVNGYCVRYITDINTGEQVLCNYDLNEMGWIPLQEIDVWESIVTKEQFSKLEYKI